VSFKASRWESWRTKRGCSWKSVGAFWGEIHGLKNISNESLCEQLRWLLKDQKRRYLGNQSLIVHSLLGLDSRVGKQLGNILGEW